MNGTKSFMKSITAYFLGNILSKLIVFIMLPLYTTYISPANYGYYDLTVTYTEFFSSILFLDIWSGTMRFMFDSKEHESKLKVIYSSLMIYGSSLILYIITFIGLNIIVKIQYFPLVLLYGFCMTLQNWYGYIARGFGKNVLFAVSGIVSTLLNVLLNILLIVGLKTSYWSLYAAYSAGILVQAAILETSLRLIPDFSVKLIDKNLIRQLLRFALPLCLNSVAYWFLTGYNRIVIVDVLGKTQNGYFATASKFAVAISLVGSCFTLAWQETAYKKEGDNEGSGAFYSKVSDLFIKFLFLGTNCVLPAIGIVFKYMVNQNYGSAKALIPLGLLGTAVSIYSFFLGNIFSAIKKTGVVSVSTLIASAVNVAVIYLTIGYAGVQAANISFLAGFCANCIIRVIMLRKHIDFRISLKPFVLYIPLFCVNTYIFLNRGIIANLVVLAMTSMVALYVFKDVIKTVWKAIEPKIKSLTR